MVQSHLYNIVADCLDKHAGQKSKTAFLSVNDALDVESFTFEKLAEQTHRFAHGLAERGIKAGDRLIISLPNGPEFPIVFLGAMRAGVIPVPSSPLLTDDELDFLKKDSGAKGVVTPENFSTFIGSSIFDIKPTLASDPAFWLYTSGTEGTPRAVMHVHRSIPAHDERVRLWQNLKSGDVVFNTSSLNWSYALTCGMLDVWRHGAATVVYSGELKPEKILGVIEKCGVTVLMSVPGIYRRLAEYVGANLVFALRDGRSQGSPLHGLRVCLSAGEKLPEEVRRNFKKTTGHEIYEGLGQTEHSVYLVQRYGELVVEGSCGKPLPGSRVAILREDLTECAAGEIGILASHRSCPGLMIGYHAKSSPSPQPSPLKGEGVFQDIPSPLEGEGQGEGAPAFQGDWFLSGDLACKDEAGNFFFVGRRDDVITAGGYRISPLEVEAVLNRHPDVVESAVVGREIEPGKTIVVGHVVCRGARPCARTSNEIITHAGKYLAKYKIPREIVYVKQLPKTRNGKIKRNKLK